MGNITQKSYIFKKIGKLLIGAFLKAIKFFPEFNKFKQMNDGRFNVSLANILPIITNETQETGFDRHYVYHTSWPLRKLMQINPAVHTDFSSSLYFIGMASAHFNIDFYDYRPADIVLDKLKTGSCDLNNLHFESNSIESLSCMHVIEHIGLGRYGDEIDPKGDLKAISELKRVCSINGNLLFVVPVGKPRILFNANRVYSVEQIISYFAGFDLVEFSLITDNAKDGGILTNPSEDILKKQTYGCGCFWFRKQLSI